MIPLEDLYQDVLGKAQRGMRLADEELAARAGVTVGDLQAAKEGLAGEETLLKLAAALDLHGPSLVTMARNAWFPRPVEMCGLAQFNTVYHDMTVNSYLVWDPATREAAAFDTGADAAPMIEFIQSQGLQLGAVFITHIHTDHILCLDQLLSATGCQHAFSHSREPLDGTELFDIGPDTAWSIGGLEARPRSTHGHAKGGVTYVVTGLANPVAIVGDALFASSMGGGMVSYADALATNRAEIFSLPGHTIICPGHGPFTSVGEEKQHNPFYPEFKAG
jgi:hydroxyacylglutathione hydrolase